MSWVFVSQCTVSGVCWVLRLDVGATVSGFNCGCIAQHVIGRRIRSGEGELLILFFPHKVMVILRCSWSDLSSTGRLQRIWFNFLHFLSPLSLYPFFSVDWNGISG